MKRFFAVWLAAVVLAAALAACGGGKTPVVSASPAVAATAAVSPSTSASAAASPADSGAKTGPTYEEQQAFEKSIDSFSAAIERRDFKEAEQFCTQDYTEYLENMTNGTGGIADAFGLAISQGYPLKLKEVRGYYVTGTAQPDFDIAPEKPTVNYLVTFGYTDSSGTAHDAGGYVQGVKGTDGVYRISGFASSL